MTTPFQRPMDFARGRNDKPYKYTFLQTERLLAGINCLMPGQSQPLHEHPNQDKFYLVLNGAGVFTVGAESKECREGELVLCEAGVAHGVENRGHSLLTFLTLIAPWE
jgi:quercetin dioxygenase-like cupin family protein